MVGYEFHQLTSRKIFTWPNYVKNKTIEKASEVGKKAKNEEVLGFFYFYFLL